MADTSWHRTVLVSATRRAFVDFLESKALCSQAFTRMRDGGNSFVADGVWYRRVYMWTQAQGYDRSTTTCLILREHEKYERPEFEMFERLRERYEVEVVSDDDIYILLPPVSSGASRIKQCTYCGSFTAEGHAVKHFPNCTRPCG